MQFISSSADVSVVIRSEKEAIYDGEGRLLHPAQPLIMARFDRGIPMPFLEKAKQAFPAQDNDERPIGRFGGFYDTRKVQADLGYTDEERELIEERLSVVSGVVRVELAKAPLPYPTYRKQRKVQGRRTLEHVITDIRASLEQTGIDPEAVVAYELDYADEHSAAVIDALTELPVTEPEETLVVA